MILKLIPSSNEDTAVDQLPEPGMVVDPRPIYLDIFKFNVTTNGTIVTVARIKTEKDGRKGPGWPCSILFRVYSRSEFHYSFDSTIYLYHGIEDEEAPKETTEVMVKYGVETIREDAFKFCTFLSKITMPNTVTRIEEWAFFPCELLRSIQLPPNLRYIGSSAFQCCTSLEAIFIPSTVTEIGFYAFKACKSLRIMNMPESAVQGYQGYAILGCHSLLTDDMKRSPSREEEVQWLRHRYNSLHTLCCDPSVSSGDIKECIQHNRGNEERARTNDKPRFTALHLLVANPSVTGEMITAYLELAPDVAFLPDNNGKSPLHMLCSVPFLSDNLGGAIRAYLASSEGKRASFMKDDKGMTPFNYLCEKDFDEKLLCSWNKSFAGLIVWWYECLGIDLFAAQEDF